MTVSVNSRRVLDIRSCNPKKCYRLVCYDFFSRTLDRIGSMVIPRLVRRPLRRSRPNRCGLPITTACSWPRPPRLWPLTYSWPTQDTLPRVATSPRRFLPLGATGLYFKSCLGSDTASSPLGAITPSLFQAIHDLGLLHDNSCIFDCPCYQPSTSAILQAECLYLNHQYGEQSKTHIWWQMVTVAFI